MKKIILALGLMIISINAADWTESHKILSVEMNPPGELMVKLDGSMTYGSSCTNQRNRVLDTDFSNNPMSKEILSAILTAYATGSNIQFMISNSACKNSDRLGTGKYFSTVRLVK